MRRLAIATVVWGALLFGAAGAVVALGSRGSEEVFQYEQSRSTALTSSVLSAASVAAVVAQAPEPVAPARRTPPAQVSCRPGGGGVLRNPWSCAIVYRSGTRAHYRLTVEPSGRYAGTGTGIISGCCVKAPTLN